MNVCCLAEVKGFDNHVQGFKWCINGGERGIGQKGGDVIKNNGIKLSN